MTEERRPRPVLLSDLVVESAAQTRASAGALRPFGQQRWSVNDTYTYPYGRSSLPRWTRDRDVAALAVSD